MRIALLLLALLLIALPARAHDFRPGVLSLHEEAPGVFGVAWTPPLDSRGEDSSVSVVYPSACRLEGSRLTCPSGLSGSLRFEGLHARSMRVAVEVRRLDGSVGEWLVAADAPSVELSSMHRRGSWVWVKLGVVHIYALDHIAFLLGLLLIVKTVRRVVATVTAFTLAHSLTLALAVLGVVQLPSAPVEATIAASVLLMAREAAVDAPTLTHRAPWLVALLFGLVHGLGFASALKALGLPPDSRIGALFGFNVGVELGQLSLVVAYFAVLALARKRWQSAGPLRTALCYAMGALAALWLIERSAAIFTSS